MWDYIIEAHRLDLHRQAETRRLARLARTERLPNLSDSLQSLRGLIVIRIESNEARPATGCQEMKPCVDAG